jgi:hypothetical protein
MSEPNYHAILEDRAFWKRLDELMDEEAYWIAEWQKEAKQAALECNKRNGY